MITYAVIAYVCLVDTPWACSHGTIGIFSSQKPLKEFCNADASLVIFRWQDQHKRFQVTGWDCVEASR